MAEKNKNRFDEDEKTYDQKLNLHVVLRIFHWIKPFKKQMITACLMMLFSAKWNQCHAAYDKHDKWSRYT